MLIHIASESEMRQFGEKLGRLLKGGECIELIGDVGSGKTTITKGIANGMGITETVQSPTFTINRTYESPSGVILSHYDFYRLADPGIMADELHEALSDKQTSVVIEWGDIVESVVPEGRLRLNFASPTADTREIILSGSGEVSQYLMERLQ